MQRTGAYHVGGWSEKTLSALRESQQEACRKRLDVYPGTGVFGKISADDFSALWMRSFYAAELGPFFAMDAGPARDRVFSCAATEADYLSRNESGLLSRVLSQNGCAALEDEDAIAAESLIQRLWCTIERRDGQVMLRLPKALTETLAAALSGAEHRRFQTLLYALDAMLHGLLYILGSIRAETAVSLMMSELKRENGPEERRMILRHLRAEFIYLYDRSGKLLFIHPGLAETEKLFESIRGDGAYQISQAKEKIKSGIEGVLPEEKSARDTMIKVLKGAVQPEYTPDEVTDDLCLLAKQGASPKEMEEVLASMLCVLPTAAIRDTLRTLHRRTVRWPFPSAAALN